MPMWLIPLVRLLGPVALKLALGFLDEKYPGIRELIKKMLGYVADEKPEHNVEALKKVLEPCIGCPTETKKI
jgi:hypothetical protein